MDVAADAAHLRLAAAQSVLRRRHQRVTPARSAVLKVLSEADHHLDAAEIVDLAAAAVPGVHRATVYRALSTLCELGVVTHTHVPGAGTVYHLVDAEAPHAHLQCSGCGRLFDLPVETLAPLTRTLRDDFGFALEPGHAALLGTCAACR